MASSNTRGVGPGRHRPKRRRSSDPPSQTVQDPYYGHGETAMICARYITYLFGCTDMPATRWTTDPSAPSPPLPNFIAFVIHRTRYEPSVTFGALYLLALLKTYFPGVRGASGHPLFLTASMIASKVFCDSTYSSKSWMIVGQGMFPLEVINKMEREMCSYLQWRLNIRPEALREFEQKVRRDFGGEGPYPTYNSNSTALPAMNLLPSFAAPTQRPPTVSTVTPLPPPVQVHAGPPTTPTSSASCDSPDPPEFSMSPTSSPTSTAGPSTPTGYQHNNVQVIPSGTTGAPFTMYVLMSGLAPRAPAPAPAPMPQRAATHAVRGIQSGQIYTRGVPCIW